MESLERIINELKAHVRQDLILRMKQKLTSGCFSRPKLSRF